MEGLQRKNGGGWRDTESLVKVKPDSLGVVMEAGYARVVAMA